MPPALKSYGGGDIKLNAVAQINNVALKVKSQSQISSNPVTFRQQHNNEIFVNEVNKK